MTRHGLDAPDVLEDGAWKSRRMVLRWVPNRLRNKGSERHVTAGACDNRSGPAGAVTPVAPGLTDCKGAG